MRVKWNRNLDGNTIIDANEPLSDYKEGKSNDPIVATKLSKSSSIPMRSKSRETGKSNRGCNLIFGSTRKPTSRSTSVTSTTSSSSSSPPPPSADREQSSSPPPPPTSQGYQSDSDRTTMTKLSNFLGIFKLTPSSPSSTNGSIKGSSKSSNQPTSIKVVRRSKSGYESDGLFRTDSRRRRRANNLLQRNSDIRRSWNAAMTGRPDVSLRGPWLRPGSPNYRPTSGEGAGGNYRSISPSIAGINLNGSRPSSSLDGSGHFGNSCKVNSMPAPIVTLPECCLEGSDCDGENSANGTHDHDADNWYDPKSSSKPGSPGIDLEIHHHHHNGHSNGYDEVDLIPDDKLQHNPTNNNQQTMKPNGSIVRPAGPPPPPPTSSTSVSYDGSLRSVDDVFIQVQITASSKCKSSDKQSTPKQSTINDSLTGKQSNGGIIVDESDRPLSPIFESCTEKVTYEESISPNGSLSDSRIDSRSSGEVEQEEEDVNTILTHHRPPSSTAGSSSSTEMTLSEDGGLGESISYDASSGCSWETSSILTGSVSLSPDGSSNHGHPNNHGESVSERMSSSPSSPSPTSPIISTSTPQSHQHHHQSSSLHPHPASPIMISDPSYHHRHPVNSDTTTAATTTSGDESYLYEPRMSEVIRVTVKKSEIPEVVTLRSEDIIDLDATGSIEDSGSPSSSSSFSSSSISSVQRISCNNIGGGSRKVNRTGILKDSNCLNANGLPNCRSATPKKVHFAESAKIRSTTTSINSTSSDINQLPSTNYDHRPSPLPPLMSPQSINNSNGSQLTPKPDRSTKLLSNNNNNNETTITTSSTVTIKKPSLSSSSSSRRLFQSSLNQNDYVETISTTNVVPVNDKPSTPSSSSSSSAGDYSSEQMIVSTSQVIPESLCLSSRSSPSSSSLSVKSQARFFESIASQESGTRRSKGGESGEGGGRSFASSSSSSEAIKSVATVEDNDCNPDYTRIRDDEGPGLRSKSQKSKPPAHDVSTINCTSSVEHVLNQNHSTNNTVSVSTVTSTIGNGANFGAGQGYPYLSRELDAHRKLSALHQRKLALAREESARSSLIIQGLGIVVQNLTRQMDNLNGPSVRSQLSQVQSNFEQLETAFNDQEEALKSLQFNYSKVESELRQEVTRLTSELADEERRHEREKAHLINSFELELDAARKQFDQELNQLETIKDELKGLVDSLRNELKAKVTELSKARGTINALEAQSRQERNGQARRVEERISFMSKEIQSLKDVLELKEKEVKRLRSQVERDEGLSRDLVRAQSTIDALRQRLEQLEIARETQTDSMNRLKAENEALIGEMIRDQREMDKLALRKEELEYTLYNMVTITGDDDDDRFNNNNNNTSQSTYDQYNNVSYSSQIVDHQSGQPSLLNGNVNGTCNGIDHHVDVDDDVIIDEDKINEMKRKRRSNQEIRSTVVSSSSSSTPRGSTNYQHLSPVTSSTSIRIEKNVSTIGNGGGGMRRSANYNGY